jgi:predicted secreted protein
MSVVSFIAVYVLIWPLVLQALLPFGLRTQAEAEEVVPGSEPAAPVRIHWKLKILLTTLISVVLWGVFYWLYRTTGLGVS